MALGRELVPLGLAARRPGVKTLTARRDCVPIAARWTRLLASVWVAREAEDQSGLLRDWCWVAGEYAALRRYAS
jgi:hypothetical protein